MVGAAQAADRLARPLPGQVPHTGRVPRTLRASLVSRWLVTGAGGMLGRDLVALLASRGEDVVGLGRQELDVTEESDVRAAFRLHRPSIVVNCAAWTAVDEAEEHEDDALRVNGCAAACLASACACIGARMVQLSTDYVFSGDASRPYAEHDCPLPRTAYGRTKLVGEFAVMAALPFSGYVVRTSWLYGEHGPNFVRTMISAAGSRPIVQVVADQRGQPTWTADVAAQIMSLMRAGADAEILHVTSSGETTSFDLAREVFGLLGADPDRVAPDG